MALPVIELWVDGIQCAVLMDTGCCHMFMSTSVCHLWRKWEVKVFTVNKKTLNCCGLGRIQIRMNGLNLVIVGVLVVEGKLHNFNLLMGRVHINQTGEVCFTMDDVAVLVALKIDKPNFRSRSVYGMDHESGQIVCHQTT